MALTAGGEKSPALPPIFKNIGVIPNLENGVTDGTNECSGTEGLSGATSVILSMGFGIMGISVTHTICRVLKVGCLAIYHKSRQQRRTS
jgi:hypothetical protein